MMVLGIMKDLELVIHQWPLLLDYQEDPQGHLEEMAQELEPRLLKLELTEL